MNQLFADEFTESMEEMGKLIENIKNNIDLYESSDKFVNIVEKNHLEQKEAFKPLLRSFCSALREKGYPVVSDSFAEKWRVK